MHLLGGINAQGEGVVDALQAAGHTVNRLAGQTRLETAVAIAEQADHDRVMIVRAFPSAGAGDPTQAFADSLGAGGIAATLGYNIVFSQTEVLSTSTAAHLRTAGYDSALIVGGTAALGQPVQDAVAAIIPDTRRIAGPSRFETNIALNELRPTPVARSAILVEGTFEDGWASAFPAANLSGMMNAPILLSTAEDVPQPTVTYITEQYGDAASFAQSLTFDPFGEALTVVSRFTPRQDVDPFSRLDRLAAATFLQADLYAQPFVDTSENPELVERAERSGDSGSGDITVFTDQSSYTIPSDPRSDTSNDPDVRRIFLVGDKPVPFQTFSAALTAGARFVLQQGFTFRGAMERVTPTQYSITSGALFATVVDVDLSTTPATFGVTQTSTLLPVFNSSAFRIPAHPLQRDVSEGDVLDMTVLSGSGFGELINSSVTGVVGDLTHGTRTMFMLRAFMLFDLGDDPDSDQDTHAHTDTDAHAHAHADADADADAWPQR